VRMQWQKEEVNTFFTWSRGRQSLELLVVTEFGVEISGQLRGGSG